MKKIVAQLREFIKEHNDLLALGVLCFFSISLALVLFKDFRDLGTWSSIFLVQFISAGIWALVCTYLKWSDIESLYRTIQGLIKNEDAALAELNNWKARQQELSDTLIDLEREIFELQQQKNDLSQRMIDEELELKQVLNDLNNCNEFKRLIQDSEKNRENEMASKAAKKERAHQKALLSRINDFFRDRGDLK